MKIVQRMKSATLSLAIGLVLLSGVAGSASAQTAAGDPGLQPGDLVEITVWQRDELSGEFTVAPDGTLNHPLYRQVRVTGLPADQIEQRLKSFLSEYEANPQIVVQPMYKVVVSGAVMRPDIYSLPPGMTVSQAVTQAGGVVENGKRDDVRLIRDARETRLDLSEAKAIQMPVQSGDEIIVRTKSTGGFRATVLPVLQIGITVANLVAVLSR